MKNGFKITATEDTHDIIVEREFQADIELVFEAFSNPDLLKKWQFPPEAEFEIEKHECCDGGRYLTWHKGSNKMRFGFKGVFHEVSKPNLIIQTSEFLGLPFKVIPTLEIIKFESLGEEQTKLIKQIICVNKDVRNAMLQNGMEQHFRTSFDRIDNLIHNENE